VHNNLNAVISPVSAPKITGGKITSDLSFSLRAMYHFLPAPNSG
jgi:hypothetical protein